MEKNMYQFFSNLIDIMTEKEKRCVDEDFFLSTYEKFLCKLRIDLKKEATKEFLRKFLNSRY
jgi:hypothetical protein